MRSCEGGLMLTDDESTSLARYTAAILLTAPATVEWGDLPELTEHDFEIVLHKLQEIGSSLLQSCDVGSVDARYVWGEAS